MAAVSVASAERQMKPSFRVFGRIELFGFGPRKAESRDKIG